MKRVRISSEILNSRIPSEGFDLHNIFKEGQAGDDISLDGQVESPVDGEHLRGNGIKFFSCSVIPSTCILQLPLVKDSQHVISHDFTQSVIICEFKSLWESL
jgi:hypothetical protein